VRLREILFESFSLLSEGLRRLESLILVTLLLGLMGMGMLQIVLRNLGVALPWADGLMRAMVLWLAMVAGVMAAGQMRHIRINLIEHWLSERWVSRFGRLACVITAIVCGVMAWYGLEMVGIEMSFGATAFLNVPTWVVQFIVPLGFALMGLRFLAVAMSPELPRPGSMADIEPETEDVR
jgi:TRAP-type C4-dicarboxylate transport system permease small subunit